MAVPESKFAWQTLLKLFRHDLDPGPCGPKFGMALALAAAADDEVIDDLITLFGESRHGLDRVPFVKPLNRSRSASAHHALEAGRKDPLLAIEIARVVDRRRRDRRSAKS